MSTTPDSVRVTDTAHANGEPRRGKNAKGNGPTGKLANTLADKDAYRLMSLLDTQRDFIQNQKMDLPELIAFVKEKTGLDVTEHNLRPRLKLFEIKLAFPKAAAMSRRGSRLSKIVQPLKDELAATTQQVGQLREEYARLLELVTSPDKLESQIKRIGSALILLASRLRSVENKVGIHNPPFELNIDK